MTTHIIRSASIIRVGACRRLQRVSDSSGRLGASTVQIVYATLKTGPRRIASVAILGGNVAGQSFLFAYGKGGCVVHVPKRKASRLVGHHRRTTICRAVSKGRVYSSVTCVGPRGNCGVARFLRKTEMYSPSGCRSIGGYVGQLQCFRRVGLGIGRRFSVFKRVRFCRAL